jgi:hypothetical protein
MKTPETLDVGEVSFLGEQDGPPERDLKRELVRLFGDVGAAYLAMVQYASGEQSVALCLASTPQAAQADLAKQIFEAFQGMFGVSSHLDILFLRPDQEGQVEQVCKAFYKRTVS